MMGVNWIFILVWGGFISPGPPHVIRDLSEAQCRAMVQDFATDRSFVVCYGPDGATIKAARK